MRREGNFGGDLVLLYGGEYASSLSLFPIPPLPDRAQQAMVMMRGGSTLGKHRRRRQLQEVLRIVRPLHSGCSAN